MSDTMQVLMVEDSDKDAALIVRELRKAGLDLSWKRVDNGRDLEGALGERAWDIVLADYEMPSFDALRALEIVRAHDSEVSFVVVSGTIGEDVAVETMRAGAQDYVMKDALARLGPLVEREIAETQVRRERARAIVALRESEARKAAILKAAEARHRLLAEAGATLVKSLDGGTMLQGVAELVVRHLADWCWIDLLDTQGRLQRVAAAASSPNGRAAQPRDVELPSAVALQAVREGKVERSSEPWSADIGSHVVVPLIARERSLGAMTLAVAPERRAYGPDDFDLLEELSARCATAIDNAQLFQEVRESVRVRDDFIAIAAHELRTPLTPLRMQAEWLAARIGTNGQGEVAPERLERSVRQLLRSSERLAALVERLLDFSQVTIGGIRLELSEHDLVALASDVIADLTGDLERLGSTVSWDVPRAPVVGRWDPHRVRLAIRNLVSNAMKFAPGEPIEVSVHAVSADARLSVRDHGPGLSPENQARLFERYQRPAPVRQYGGFGLGLWIVRRVAEEHGGHVEVRSEAGQGAEFTLVLPRLSALTTEDLRLARSGTP